MSFPLKVAIVGTNNDKMYSGGRYHALIMAYAMARLGIEVTFVTNKKPRFFDDLDPLAPGEIRYVYTGDFRNGMPKEAFDFVVLIPTGIFHPGFYEAAFDFIQASDARLALVNFESGNWFNAVSPVPRDLRLWEYWRRAVADGGLVISSLRVSDRHARDFYGATEPETLRFEVCGPPINSPAADKSFGRAKDGSVVTFVRSSDPHKGGQDLLALPAEILRGRKLKVIAGGPVEPDFSEALKSHFLAGGAEIEFHIAVSDEEKFALIAGAQAVLFPSRFEGFGYPPVEAAYCGTEIVCYDLPVLRETVGEVAQMAPVGDVDALAAALGRALEMPARRKELHAAAASLVGIEPMGLRLGDILLRSLDAVPVMRQVSGAMAWGPFSPEDADAAVNTVPPLPSLSRSYRRTGFGGAILSFQICCPQMPDHVSVSAGDISLGDVATVVTDIRDNWQVLNVTGHFATLPPEGSELQIRLLDEDGMPLTEASMSVGLPGEEIATSLQLTGLWPEQDSSRIELRCEGRGTHLVMRCGDQTSWHRAGFRNDRVTLDVSTPDLPDSGMSVYVFDGHDAIGYFCGCPPMPHAGFEPASGKIPGSLPIVDLQDKHWFHGVLRNPDVNDGGIVVCGLPPSAIPPTGGDVVRLASGRCLTLASTRRKADVIDLRFGVPIDPETEGAPGSVDIVFRRDSQALPSDGGVWDTGVWTGAGPFSHRCLQIPFETIAALDGQDPALLDAAGREIEIEKLWYTGPVCIAWLGEVIRPGTEFQVIPSSAGAGLALLPAEDGAEPDMARASWTVDLVPEAAVSVGNALVFSGHHLRFIHRVEKFDDRLTLHLDMALPDGAPSSVRLASFREQADFSTLRMLHPSGVTGPGISPFMAIGDTSRRAHAPLPMNPATDRPRVLFASIVPPYPADQGNRIVTRNFISHLVSMGFDVDLLLVGRVLPEQIVPLYGNRVRVFSWPFPNWIAEPSAALKQKIIDDIRALYPAPEQQGTLRRLLEEAATYHPFFIVPDAIIRMAQALYRTTEYHSIVCNYTHMIRVACELAPIRPLPPVTIITHDALSRLPLEFEGKPLNTMYRLCSPETERDVLDAVPNATVLAISTSEERYFREIGVSNPIELCEYDGFQECSRYRVPVSGFARRRLLFHASGNPMNRVAIDWFLQSCWPRILDTVPEARLVICGGICSQIDGSIPGLELHGNVPREELMEILGNCSIAINPTLAGTGLKIKTVEAVCTGLPSVCLPAAIEGLEAVVDRFCLLERKPGGFTEACIRLLTNEQLWTGLRNSSLELAEERFSEQAIYGPVDHRMGWDQDIEGRHATDRPDYTLAPPISASDFVAHLPDDTQGRGLLVRELEELGEISAASRLATKIVNTKRGFAPPILRHVAALADVAENPQGALRAGGELYGHAPTEASNMAAMARIYAGLGKKQMVADIWQLMALAIPASPDTIALAEELDLSETGKITDLWQRPLLKIRKNTPQYMQAILPKDGQIGPGWSDAEEWGAWTNGNFARLDLTFAPTRSALNLALYGKARVDGNDAPRIVRLNVDGKGVGRFELPSTEEREEFLSVELPASKQARNRLSLEFFIENPVPARAEDGRLIDGRLMGLALWGVLLQELK